MNTKKTGFWCSKMFASLYFTKVASALEGLSTFDSLLGISSVVNDHLSPVPQ